MLLTGESGTGKELLAAHIHRESPFASRPFVKVNCAAIPTELIESELFGHERGAFTGATGMRRGKFELADGGTIFLDEVGDLHEASQAKLLRVLQDGEVQRLGSEQSIRVAVRVISATNRRLDERIADGKFREDLYYRLSVVPIRVPALRERLQDVRELAAYFLSEFCTRNNFRPKAIDEDVLQILERHHWPGNIRELRNTVERMAILSPEDRITVESIPLEIRTPAGVAAVRPARDSRLGRARSHPSGARADRRKRLRRGASARHRAHEPSQADEGARSESRLDRSDRRIVRTDRTVDLRTASDSNNSIDLDRTLERWKRRDPDQQHQTRPARVRHAMRDAGRRPDDHALPRASRLVADDELAGALGDEIELVLIGVRVRVLRLARLEAVQSEHQAPALKERRLELLVGIRCRHARRSARNSTLLAVEAITNGLEGGSKRPASDEIVRSRIA